MIGTNWGENKNKRGVFFDGAIGGRMSLATITDGTSNTMLFSEILASNSSGSDVKSRARSPRPVFTVWPPPTASRPAEPTV